ncbi:DUF2637 domain-containing protein [Streptomyces sp. NPDC058249]|uniref:DUF2637 domain-containing protein n=1 Tax=Streptomyces sp. NPDC058249 TaxID=3346403 RepID=UPI0036E723DC
MDRIRDESTLHDIRFDLRTGYDPVDRHLDDIDRLGEGHLWRVPDTAVSPDAWDPAEELAEMLYTTSSAASIPSPRDGHRRPRRPADRRRHRPGPRFMAGKRKIITVAILVAMITVCAVMMLGWSISYSYNQLRVISLLVVSARLAKWWPLTVYGPWLVAGLSILRAAVQQRTARRSWAVLLLASGTAVALCVGHSPRSVLAMVVVGIPPITALVCFRELVGQILPENGPRHSSRAVNRSKRTTP